MYVVDIKDARVLAKDKAECEVHARNYREPLDITSIGSAAVQGAGKNAAGAIVNPLVPVIGAAGAAGSQTLDSLNILSSKQLSVYRKCLEHRGLRSGAYDMLSPD